MVNKTHLLSRWLALTTFSSHALIGYSKQPIRVASSNNGNHHVCQGLKMKKCQMCNKVEFPFNNVCSLMVRRFIRKK